MKNTTAFRFAALALAISGCGGSSAPPHPILDMAEPQDLAPVTMNDLALPGGDMATNGGDVTTAHGDVHQYVIDSVTIPQTRSDFAIDLNGDGKPDNQLGSIIGALAAQGLDASSAVQQSVSQGDSIYLLAMQTADAALQNDDTVGVTYHAGKVHVLPDFSGAGSFTIDGAIPAAPLFGRLVQGAFSSNNPVTTTHPVTLTLKLALISGGVPVNFPLNGAHIQFTTGTDANSGAPGLVMGQINGSIKNSDVQANIIPAVAQLLNQEIALNPQQGQQILAIFDSGGCVNPDGTMAQANDGKIDICEVSGNQIVQNLLAPDVQIFDAKGNYAPNAHNDVKDSLSVGIAFTAVKAMF